MKTMTKFTLTLALIAATCHTPIGAQTAQAVDMAPMAEMAGSAKTAAEHEKVAAEYDRQATEARASSELHKTMGEAYGKSAGFNSKGSGNHFRALSLHCGNLTKMMAGAAAQYVILAKEHRTLAAMAK